MGSTISQGVRGRSFCLEINCFSALILKYVLPIVSQGNMKTFFLKEVGQWFGNPDLDGKGVPT